MNTLLARSGGYAYPNIPWFRMKWAQTDFIIDGRREYPRCMHERQDSYHILRWYKGGEYLCTGIHLLDTSTCQPHRTRENAILREGEICTCTPVSPTATIAELIAPMIEHNRVKTQRDHALAMEARKLRERKAKDERIDMMLEPFNPTLSGRMPEKDHPDIKRVLENSNA